jgi:hypothetical protein
MEDRARARATAKTSRLIKQQPCFFTTKFFFSPSSSSYLLSQLQEESVNPDCGWRTADLRTAMAVGPA